MLNANFSLGKGGLGGLLNANFSLGGLLDLGTVSLWGELNANHSIDREA